MDSSSGEYVMFRESGSGNNTSRLRNYSVQIGDLAMFHKTLDLPRVLPELLEACKDDSIRDPAETSISFIKQALKTQ